MNTEYPQTKYTKTLFTRHKKKTKTIENFDASEMTLINVQTKLKAMYVNTYLCKDMGEIDTG